MTPDWSDLEGVVWDWGDTLMRNIPGQPGPMAGWPRVEAVPGAAEALGALAFIPVHCVATNATESDGAQVAAALERVGLRRVLTHFLTSRELGARKPNPDFFLRVSREIGIEARRLVSIGNDLRNDIAPAKAAGLATVWLAPDGRGSDPGAVDLVVPSLARLADIVGESRRPPG